MEISNVTIEFSGQVNGNLWTINTPFTEFTFKFEDGKNCSGNPNDTDEAQIGLVAFSVTPHGSNDVKMSWDLDGLVEDADEGYDLFDGFVYENQDNVGFQPAIIAFPVANPESSVCSTGIPLVIEEPKNFIPILKSGTLYDLVFVVNSIDEFANTKDMFYNLKINYAIA